MTLKINEMLEIVLYKFINRDRKCFLREYDRGIAMIYINILNPYKRF